MIDLNYQILGVINSAAPSQHLRESSKNQPLALSALPKTYSHSSLDSNLIVNAEDALETFKHQEVNPHASSLA